MIKNLKPLKKDNVLEVFEAFKQDPRTDKVNLTIGLYTDENGLSKVFNAVRFAEREIVQKEFDKVYLPIRGTQGFLSKVTEYILGEPREDFLVSYGSGGTGALRIAAELIAKACSVPRIWIGYPSWENHTDLFEHANFNVIAYPWLDENNSIPFNEIIEQIKKKGKEGDWFLLQGCCHNPTGLDLSYSELKELLGILKTKAMHPIFDIAYHGFAKNIYEDIVLVREAADSFENLIICYSFSKVMGLYNDRCGALLIKTNEKEKGDLKAQVEAIARLLFFTPPATGIRIVECILGNNDLKGLWLKELNEQRERLIIMRQELFKRLNKGKNFHYLLESHGLFLKMNLTSEQINLLKSQYGIYLLENGRINVAGLNYHNLDRVAAALNDILNL